MEHLAAVAPRQLHVDQHDREGLFGQKACGLGLVVGDGHAVAAVTQQVPEIRTQVGIVIDHQHQRLAQCLIDQAQQMGEIDRLGQHLPCSGGQPSSAVALLA